MPRKHYKTNGAIRPDLRSDVAISGICNDSHEEYIHFTAVSGSPYAEDSCIGT